MNTSSFEESDREPAAGTQGNFLGQIPVILAERKWFIIIPTLLGLVAAIALIVFLPTKYQSEAVLLVQAPSLPTDIVSGQDEAVAQRIEAIRQKIVNRPALIELIQRNDLYSDRRKGEPLSGIVDDMRDAIVVEPQNVDLGGTGREKTIAVTLSYTYDDPAKVQAVAQQLTERVVEVDSTTNAEQLTQTVQFLTAQQQDIERQLAEAEGELAAFNTRYGGILAASGSSMIGGGGAVYDMQIGNLQREISEMEAQKRLLRTAGDRDPAVVQAEGALAAARAAYTDDHPDVLIARQRLEQAKAIARENVDRIPTGELDNRLSGARGQLAALQAARSRDAGLTSAAIAQRSQSPAVAQQAAQLQQGVAALNKQADDISNRLLAAKASQRASEEQMGERLVVVDPPVVPDTPSSPNRPLIFGLSLAAGLALGILLALAWELLMRPIRDPSVLVEITGQQPLALVPAIGKPLKPNKRRWRFRRSRGPQSRSYRSSRTTVEQA